MTIFSFFSSWLHMWRLGQGQPPLNHEEINDQDHPVIINNCPFLDFLLCISCIHVSLCSHFLLLAAEYHSYPVRLFRSLASDFFDLLNSSDTYLCPISAPYHLQSLGLELSMPQISGRHLELFHAWNIWYKLLIFWAQPWSFLIPGVMVRGSHWFGIGQLFWAPCGKGQVLQASSY